MNGTMKRGTVEFQSPVSRRVFLRGAGGALALPLFNDLIAPEARAQGMTAPYPKRLIVLFSPNGTIPENYFGPGATTTFTLGSIMTPLTPHKSNLLVLDGIDMKAAAASAGDAHGVGMGCMLTGKKLQAGSQFVAGMGGPGSGWPDNISLDQLVAKTVGANTPLPSIELAGKRFAGNIWSRMSYSGPAAPVSPQEDPQRAFDTVFGTAPPGAAAAAKLALRRKSVLDNALGELDGPERKARRRRQEEAGRARHPASRPGDADQQHADRDVRRVHEAPASDGDGQPRGHRQQLGHGANQRLQRQNLPGHHQGAARHHRRRVHL